MNINRPILNSDDRGILAQYHIENIPEEPVNPSKSLKIIIALGLVLVGAVLLHVGPVFAYPKEVLIKALLAITLIATFALGQQYLKYEKQHKACVAWVKSNPGAFDSLKQQMMTMAQVLNGNGLNEMRDTESRFFNFTYTYIEKSY